MRSKGLGLVGGLGALGLSIALGIAAPGAAPDEQDQGIPEVPATPAPVKALISAQPFRLEQGSPHQWRAERPVLRTGYLLVLEVDPDLVYPRQSAEPVLYVGHQTAERINHGHESGRVVAIVPAVLDDPEHPEHLDLERALIWFGTPALPEQVDAAIIRREHAAALRAGIVPLPSLDVQAARTTGGPVLEVASKHALLDAAARLLREHSPQEKALADALQGQPGPAARRR